MWLICSCKDKSLSFSIADPKPKVTNMRGLFDGHSRNEPMMPITVDWLLDPPHVKYQHSICKQYVTLSSLHFVKFFIICKLDFPAEFRQVHGLSSETGGFLVRFLTLPTFLLIALEATNAHVFCSPKYKLLLADIWLVGGETLCVLM